uniref:Beta-microseminoprotein n=1 Tax=Erpetoichthys calabaricus TaxID=27687 RepID=A0A8C4X2E3_ERPCA
MFLSILFFLFFFSPLDGRYVIPTYCTDPFDETIYQSGTKWRTSNCMDCYCEMGGFECCQTNHLYIVPGCKRVLTQHLCAWF